jgi:hypothetical protein
MSRSLRKFCFTAAFSAFSLTLSSPSVEAVTLLMRTPPKLSVLDNPLLTSSYYDLYWVTIEPDAQTTVRNISNHESQRKFRDTIIQGTTQQKTREIIAELPDESIPQDDQRFINNLRDKSTDTKNKNTLDLAESNKMLQAIRAGNLQEDNSNNPIQGRDSKISENLKQRYQDDRLDIDTENTITLGRSSQLINSINSEDKISTLKAKELFSDGLIKPANNLFINDNLLIVLATFLALVSTHVFCLIFFDKQLMAFMGISGKPKVPNESVFLHNRLMQEIEKLAGRLQYLDDTKFTEAEFLRFLRWENEIGKGKNEYQYLREPIQLLQVGLNAKNSFLALEQAEFSYRGSRQQEFYNYITELLKQNLPKDQFKSEVEFKLVETLPTLMTEEGQQALISYSQELYKLAETDLALKLMLLFRQYEFQNYSILKSIADIIDKTGGKDLLDTKVITSLVSFHFDDFEKVSKIIGLSQQYTTVDTYTKILQYLGLASRHGKDYYEFQELISIVKQWQKPYKSLTHIRQQYSCREYDLPKDFTQTVPGEKVVRKYHEFA